jgi:hypothetical protein
MVETVSMTEWFSVWVMRDGYEGHWHPVATTRTEAERVCKALNEFARERNDSLGWRYEVRPVCDRCKGTGCEPNDTGENAFDGDPCSACCPAESEAPLSPGRDGTGKDG